MTNRANLARQIATYALAHPDRAAPLIEYLAFQSICHSDPSAIAKLIPETETTMGAALVASLTTYHHELQTQAAKPVARREL